MSGPEGAGGPASPREPSPTAAALIRLAAWTAPRPDRARMCAEWLAELHGEAAAGQGPVGVRAVLGAFADARELRRIRRRREGRWGMEGWRTGVGHDLAIALRGLRRAPGFTAVAVLMLALGIGGTTAMYAVLDRVVLDPLPYPEAERLVRLDNVVPGVAPDAAWAMSTAQWVYLTEHATTLDAVGLYRYRGGNLVTRAGPERVHGVQVTASVMELLGARSAVGRVLTPADDEPAAAPVAVLSHGFWTRALGADPAVVGRVLSFDDQPLEVVGVLAPGIGLPGWQGRMAPDVWMPMRIDRGGSFFNSHLYPGIARLAGGADPSDAATELARLTARLPDAFPQAYSQAFFDRYGFRTRVTPLKDSVLGDLADKLWILFAGLGLVLVVACANVLNLFVVRMQTRRRELGIRIALGAARTGVARYVFAEALALSLLGGALGIVLGAWAVPSLSALVPTGIPLIGEAGVGPGALAFGLGLSCVVALGLAAHPLLASRRLAPGVAIAAGGRGSSSGPGGQRVHATMVVIQVAVALVLVVASGLMLDGLRRLRATDVGFRPEGVLALDLYLSPQRYPDDAHAWNFHRAFLERVRALPGVSAAGVGLEVPVSGGYGCTVQTFEEESVPARVRDAGLTTCAGQQVVTPGYFESLGIPLLEGRLFAAADNDDPTRAAVVVSRAFAERFWPGESALGKGVAPPGQTGGAFYRVVGVVGDVPRESDAGAAPLSQDAIAIYYPARADRSAGATTRWWNGSGTLVVRTDLADPIGLAPAIRALVAEADPEAPVANARTMEQVVADALGESAFLSLLLALAAGTCLSLAAVGLYGVISYSVSTRTREIGMRLAVGAAPGDVRRQVVRGSLALAATGVVSGVALAFALSGVVERLLVGAEGAGTRVYAGGAAVLVLVAWVAAWLPASRAAAVDPAVALRAE